MGVIRRTTRSQRYGSAGPRQVTGQRKAPPLTEEEWIQRYTGRILRAWFHQPTAVGLAWTYANWIHKQLTDSYSDPLKKAFIEKTY